MISLVNGPFQQSASLFLQLIQRLIDVDNIAILLCLPQGYQVFQMAAQQHFCFLEKANEKVDGREESARFEDCNYRM